MSSSSSALPNYTPYPWSILGTQQQVTHESSTPATGHPHYYSPIPAPHFTTPLSRPPIRSGLSLTPSEIGISPPPVSVALQIPSIPLIPSPPTHIIPPNSLHLLSSRTISDDRPPLPSILSQPSNMPLSLPYSWEVPAPPVIVSTANRNSTSSIQTNSVTSTLLSHSVSSVFTTPISSTTLAVTHSQQAVKTSVPLPDLSLTTMSIPVSTPRDVISPSQSESSLDIEASLARMSTLARSVLQELAEDRGQLLKVSQPLSCSHTPNSKPFHTILPSTIPQTSTMTTVTSQDSTCNSELTLTTTTIDSISTTPGTSPAQERKDQP